jgi:hypothetical protein
MTKKETKKSHGHTCAKNTVTSTVDCWLREWLEVHGFAEGLYFLFFGSSRSAFSVTCMDSFHLQPLNGCKLGAALLELEGDISAWTGWMNTICSVTVCALFIHTLKWQVQYVFTFQTHLRGMGFWRVRNYLPVPLPVATCGWYLCGYHNPCHTLSICKDMEERKPFNTSYIERAIHTPTTHGSITKTFTHQTS